MQNKIDKIVEWIKKKATEAHCDGFVVGVSGGIDSALTSTLAAKTGMPTIVLNMPIHQQENQISRSDTHILWLKKQFSNVSSHKVELTHVFDNFDNSLPLLAKGGNSLANSRSRLRMMTLYSFANSLNFLVAGTGNKVEDYGIGFFTKYGDGGVDISPIADLLKSEVYAMAEHLKISQVIVDAPPTDGLWGDNRTDEDQIGATYEELEWALNFHDSGKPEDNLSSRQKTVLDIYKHRHYINKHKLEVPPVCVLKS